MKRLLFITPGFPANESQTHVVPFVQQFVLAFHQQFPEIELMVVAIHKPVSQPYHWNGISVIPLNGDDIKYPSKAIFLIQSFFKIRKFCKQQNFDGILNFWYQEFSVLSNLQHGKNFTWLQGQDVRKTNRTLRIFKPDPKKIVAISPFNNEVLFETAGIRAYKIIPIGIDRKVFPELNTGQRDFDIFGAGWLTPLKNFRLFVEVISELKKTNPNIKAAIAGSGSEEVQLKQWVKENDLEQNVVFLGLLSHAETLEKMNRSKIFLHTSTFEGGATVYSEALFSGCQLIGTLPLFDREMAHFHHHSQKSDIVAKVNGLLGNLPAPQRILYYKMETVCEETYRLFYG